MKKVLALTLVALHASCASPPIPIEPATPTFEPEAEPPPAPNDSILLTIFLRHDQSKSLAEIQALQDEQGFWSKFPPPGTSIVSWHVVMGIGQVVTHRVPPAKLRDVNVALEKTAWKAFRTEYYATYDLWPVIASKLPNATKEGTTPAAAPTTIATDAPSPPPTAPQATTAAPPTAPPKPIKPSDPFDGRK